MSNITFGAEMTGTWYEVEGLSYCEDDNSYTPYTYNRQAWCSPVALRCELTCAWYPGNLFEQMFETFETKE